MAKIEPTVATPLSSQDAAVTAQPNVTSIAPAQQEVLVPAPATATASEPRGLDQLSRIEDKTARIEEKFARYEAVLTRAEASLERSAHKVDTAAGAMDFANLRDELSSLRARVDATPRAGTLFTTALVTAVLTVVLTILVLRFGVPGLMPALIVR